MAAEKCSAAAAKLPALKAVLPAVLAAVAASLFTGPLSPPWRTSGASERGSQTQAERTHVRAGGYTARAARCRPPTGVSRRRATLGKSATHQAPTAPDLPAPRAGASAQGLATRAGARHGASAGGRPQAGSLGTGAPGSTAPGPSQGVVRAREAQRLTHRLGLLVLLGRHVGSEGKRETVLPGGQTTQPGGGAASDGWGGQRASAQQAGAVRRRGWCEPHLWGVSK